MLEASAANAAATVAYAPAQTVSLNPGETKPVSVTVTAEDGVTTKTYTVNVFRPVAAGIIAIASAADLAKIGTAGYPLRGYS
jgi:VCBS repeat-containing protein